MRLKGIKHQERAILCAEFTEWWSTDQEDTLISISPKGNELSLNGNADCVAESIFQYPVFVNYIFFIKIFSLHTLENTMRVTFSGHDRDLTLCDPNPSYVT